MKLQLCIKNQECRTLSFAIREYNLGGKSGHYVDRVVGSAFPFSQPEKIFKHSEDGIELLEIDFYNNET
jgi:hypothetical protein